MIESVKATFRNAMIKDYEAFNEIYTKVTYLGDLRHSRKPMEFKSFCEYVEMEDIILCEVSGKVVGYAIVMGFDDGQCELREIFILNEYQDRGIGRKFVSEIERIAREAGMHKIILWSATVITDRIWERMGYRTIAFSEEYQKNL